MNKMSTFLRESSTARFFIPLGIILIIFGTIMFMINKENQNYIKTEAVVSKTELAEEAHYDNDDNYVEATYTVYVKYTVDGKEYDEELGELSGYKKDQKITIYYNPQDPSKITQTKSLILPIAFVIAGMMSLTGGIMSGLNAIKRVKKMKEQERSWKNE